MDDKRIQQNCKLILTKYPFLRNSLLKKQRIWQFWVDVEGVNIGITKRQFIELTDGESISRAFRKIQQENKGLRANIELQQKSAELAEQHRKAYSKSLFLSDNFCSSTKSSTKSSTRSSTKKIE